MLWEIIEIGSRKNSGSLVVFCLVSCSTILTVGLSKVALEQRMNTDQDLANEPASQYEKSFLTIIVLDRFGLTMLPELLGYLRAPCGHPRQYLCSGNLIFVTP